VHGIDEDVAAPSIDEARAQADRLIGLQSVVGPVPCRDIAEHEPVDSEQPRHRLCIAHGDLAPPWQEAVLSKRRVGDPEFEHFEARVGEFGGERPAQNRRRLREHRRIVLDTIERKERAEISDGASQCAVFARAHGERQDGHTIRIADANIEVRRTTHVAIETGTRGGPERSPEQNDE